ncbi:cobyrinate a,c-diamide synthase [Sulfolobus tengchongensis]|uniref:Cobyrinate a,c-diamide synthase n=1 Tax=Sulfolobus tengchongensis TaxID=207809 RepID=A0AAX4L1A4_9CREN
MKRILISSDRSGSGKTLITSALMRTLSKKYKVRGFKAGPDFIDPGYHKIATGYPSINLDLWMMGEENVKKSIVKYGKGFDVGIIEGVMGLYDGVNTSYSTYEISKVTKTPIVLVINCSNIGSTAGAIIKGLKYYRNDIDIRGVIFNKVGSEAHYSYCKNSVEDAEVLGYIPFDKNLEVKSRHLGLITIEDNKEVQNLINTASELVEKYIDVDKLLEIANDEELKISLDSEENEREIKPKIAIAYDSAFSFYYQENLDLLKSRYELKFFSPLNNEYVENAEAIYIGGGYPELHLSELENAVITKNWLKKMSYSGVKIYAECGGLMYLSKNLVDENNKKYSMVGIFDIDIKAKDKLTIGYTELEAIKENFLARKNAILRGHEFHVSKPLSVNEKEFIFKVRIGRGITEKMDGVKNGNTIASYSHLHFSNFQQKIVF